MKKINSRKGQVTLFVIIGAVVLLSVVLFMIISTSILSHKPRIDIPDVSLEARPAVSLVTKCLEETASEGLKKIGANGGMLNPPAISYPSYRGEALQSGPDTIPFWRHLSDKNCNNAFGCEKVNIPPLCKSGDCYGEKTGSNSIQEQLETYVTSEIENCIMDFTSLDKMYDVKRNGKPKVEVFFRDGSTDFQLDYPLKIKSLTTDNTVEHEKFLASIDVDMLGMYGLATDIVNFERTTNYYEKQTMNLVNMYSGLDPDLLPPTSEIDFQFKRFIPWISFDVKETIEDDLLPFMNFVTFPNTDNFAYMKGLGNGSGDEEYISRGIYSSFNPKINDEVYPYNVYTEYNYDNIFFQIDDGNVLIKPRNLLGDDDASILTKLSKLSFQDYRFNYDISYPLVIRINDELANHFNGYDFQFAIEVNVRNNIPAYDNFTYIPITPTPEGIGLADFNQRLPQGITINTRDWWEDKPLDGVLISYVCGKEYSIGLTSYDDKGKASLTTTMPYCEMGGFIKYEKQGYLGESFAYNNKLNGTNQEFTVKLWPEKEKQILLKKRTMDDIKRIKAAGTGALALYATAFENISADQTGFINLERKKTSPYDTTVPLPGFVSIEGLNSDYESMKDRELQELQTNFLRGYINESTRDKLTNLIEEEYANQVTYTNTDTKTTTLKVVPGNFSIEGTLIDKSGVHIPEMTFKDYQEGMGEESGGPLEGLLTNLLLDADNFNLSEQNFSSWVVGGIKINLSLTPAEVYNDNPIVIFLIEQEKPTNWIELSKFKELAKLQEGNEYYIQPYTS